jgi:hypothetical protein
MLPFVAVFALAGIADVPRHLADARGLVNGLALADTAYTHGPGTITWTGTPSAECDCSGLLNLLLAHSYGTTDDDLKAWFGAKRPVARRYYDTIAEGNVKAWAKVAVADAKPGDVIAVKYADVEPGGNTGHVMLLDGVPKKQPDKPAGVDGAAAEWHLSVIDSTASPHGTTDTRYEKGAKHTGVGRGTFRIYTGEGGEVVGYTWSTEGKKVQPQSTHSLVIGRLVR